MPSDDTLMRVLVYAPVGRDAELIGTLLERSDIDPHTCTTPEELAACLRLGAGTVVLSHEALTGATLDVVDGFVARQETWSDLPIVALLSGGRRRGDTIVAEARRRTMTVLERPTRPATLVTVVRSALRARARQYQIRDLLIQLEDARDRLERRVRQRTEQLSASNARLTTEIRERIAAADLLEGARAEAEAERRRVTTILESISDAFVAVDEAFRFTYANARARAIFGQLVEDGRDVIGLSLWETMPDGRTSAFGEALLRAMDARASVHVEEYAPSLSTWFEVHAYPSEDGLAIYLQDITTRKRTEAELREAIEAVMSDTAWFSRSLLEKLAHVRTRNHTGASRAGISVAQLTPRERQVLERLAAGWDNAQIASDLGLAEQTVRNYVTNVYEKLRVRSRAEAVVWARDRGLTAP
jgi:PAS domain S-box-containing protein